LVEQLAGLSRVSGAQGELTEIEERKVDAPRVVSVAPDRQALCEARLGPG
jgi:hypothetical protein